MPFVILMRRRHLNNTTFFVFPKRVILKKENNTVNVTKQIELKRNWEYPDVSKCSFVTKGFTSSAMLLMTKQ